MKRELKPATIAKHMRNGVEVYGMTEKIAPYLDVHTKKGCALGSIRLSIFKGDYEKAEKNAENHEDYANLGIKPELAEAIDRKHMPSHNLNIQNFAAILGTCKTQDEAIEKFRSLDYDTFIK